MVIQSRGAKIAGAAEKSKRNFQEGVHILRKGRFYGFLGPVLPAFLVPNSPL